MSTVFGVGEGGDKTDRNLRNTFARECKDARRASQVRHTQRGYFVFPCESMFSDIKLSYYGATCCNVRNVIELSNKVGFGAFPRKHHKQRTAVFRQRRAPTQRTSSFIQVRLIPLLVQRVKVNKEYERSLMREINLNPEPLAIPGYPLTWKVSSQPLPCHYLN